MCETQSTKLFVKVMIDFMPLILLLTVDIILQSAHDLE